MDLGTLTLTLLALLPAAGFAFARLAGLDGHGVMEAVSKTAWLTAGCVLLLALAAAGLGTTLDPVALSLSFLTLFVGGIVFSYSCRHMAADRRLASFAGRGALLLSASLLLVTADHILLFAAAWIASGRLLADAIGHVPGWPEAQAARTRARRTFWISDIALVGGLAVIVTTTDSWSFAGLRIEGMSPLALLTAGALLLVSALARCAVPPFHKWLMGSMTAPTPISALMHAGLVNAGGLLLIRAAPLMEAAPAVKVAAIVVGAAAALAGVGIMAVRPDVKRALGGSTVAQMGFMIMTCGFGAYAAALWHLIAHGLFKAWLFLGAGSSIGRPAPRRLQPWTAGTAIQSAALALAVAIAATGAGSALGLPLPTMLALVAGFGSAFVALQGQARGQVLLLVPIALLGLAYAGGILVAEHLLALPAGEVPVGPATQLVLLGLFLAAWVWQASNLPLPASLYVRLLNTGGPAIIR